MNRRTFLLWIIPSILTVLLAMQLARYISRSQPFSLTSVRSSLTPTHWKSFASQSTTQPNDRSNTDKMQDQEEKANEHLGLPAPPADGIKLDVSTGEGVSFDSLGPMVVNKDGTLSRITNWDKMAPIEKENTMRILKKRNKQRLDALEKQDGQDGGNEK